VIFPFTVQQFSCDFEKTWMREKSLFYCCQVQ